VSRLLSIGTVQYYVIAHLRPGAVHKDVRKTPQSDIFRQGESLQMRTFDLFVAKNLRFYVNYGVPAQKMAERRDKAERTFLDREEGGQFFAVLCGHLLGIALYLTSSLLL